MRKSAAFGLLIFFTFISCSNRIKNAAVVVSEGTVTVAGEEIKSLLPLLPGMSVLSGSHSFAFVRFTGAIVILYPDTEITIGESFISFQSGMIYLSIKKGEKVEVRSPSNVLSLKGGQGIIAIDSGSSLVKILSGSCVISPSSKESKKIHLMEKYSVDLIDGKSGSLLPLRENDLHDFSVLSSILPDFDISSSPKSAVPFDVRDILMRENAAELSDTFQLKRLAMKNGPLRTVTLSGGKKYIGTISVRGKTTDIETVSGKVSVPSRQVLRVAVFE